MRPVIPWIYVVLLSITVNAPAAAQDKRQGEEMVTHSFSYDDQVLKMGTGRSAIVRHLNGISTNDKGAGLFHNLVVQCIALIDVVDGKPASNGRCTETDQDGDQIYSTFENKAGVGAHTLVGGTGKYKGISGIQVIKSFTNIKGPDGISGVVIPLRVTWAMP